MARYDRIWATLANRAAKQGGVNAKSFLEMAEHTGMDQREIGRRLLEDLDNNGPIFGNFTRALAGAASTSVLAAERQGVAAGTVLAKNELSRLINISDLEDAIDDADADALEEITNAAISNEEFMWICTLENTCYLCLPLHGKQLTQDEWNALGASPETMHDGWQSVCHCQLVLANDAKSREELVTPLVRNKIPGSKRTAKGIAQADVDRARTAVTKAMGSEEGRAILRRLGSVRAPDAED